MEKENHYLGLQRIVNQNRQLGNTTWILKAAINEPLVMIVCRNHLTCVELEKAYKVLLQKEPWYKKLYWWCFGRSNPKFVSVQTPDNLRGTNFPIVFDNSAIF